MTLRNECWISNFVKEERMNSMRPAVLIIILNYVTYELTLKVIEDIHAGLDYDNYAIMVVDNCSPNESAEILEKKSKELNYLFYANRSNAGYAAGNNIGIRYGIEHSYQYSWILNNDVELREKNILKELVDVLEKKDTIACIGLKIYNADGSVCAPYCRRPTVWNQSLGAFEDRRYRISKQNTAGEVYRVYGCCMLLRNKAMAEVDCMDERTFLYGEEVILAERLVQKGYRTYYEPTVSITHLGSVSIKKSSPDSKRRMLKMQQESRELYLKEYRHYSRIERWIWHAARQIRAYMN